MRTLLVFVMLAVSISFAQAQDAAQAAQQQAVQQALINSQIAQQNAQQAIQQAQQAAQTFQQAAQSDPAPVCCSAAGKPRFSVKSGNYASAKTVRITDSTRGAIIYFTTNGWTPTTSSNRYMGPITIPATTTLQAIAVFPYYGPYG